MVASNQSISGTDKKRHVHRHLQGQHLTCIVNDVEIATVKDEEIPDAGLAGFKVSAEDVPRLKWR